jgi:PPOX class probable F420-dependent enzyme
MTIDNSEAARSREMVPDPFAPLYAHKYMQLTTYRKNGTGVPTPVWFAAERGKLYVMTLSGTGKVRRIRNNGTVRLAPCTRSGQVVGDALNASARELSPDEYTIAEQPLSRRYGLMYRLFVFMQKLGKSQRTYIEIVPEDSAG